MRPSVGAAAVVRDGAVIRMEVAALLEGGPMPLAQKKIKVRGLKTRGLNLGFKFTLVIGLLVLFVTAMVSVPLGVFQVRTQGQNLARGLAQKAGVLLESVTQGARTYLPAENILELGFLPQQVQALAEAEYVTITGYGSRDSGDRSTDPDAVWASNDPAIRTKLDGPEFRPGRSRLTDPISARIPEIAAAVDKRAAEEVGSIAETLARLTEEARTLAVRITPENEARLSQIAAATRDLERTLNERLQVISRQIMGSEPAYDPAGPGSRHHRVRLLQARRVPAGAGRYLLPRHGPPGGLHGSHKRRAPERHGQPGAHHRVHRPARPGRRSGRSGRPLMVHRQTHPEAGGCHRAHPGHGGQGTAEGRADRGGHPGRALRAGVGGEHPDRRTCESRGGQQGPHGGKADPEDVPAPGETRQGQAVHGPGREPGRVVLRVLRGSQGSVRGLLRLPEAGRPVLRLHQVRRIRKGIPAAIISVEVATLFLNHFTGWKSDKGIHLDALCYQINDLVEGRGFEGKFAALTMGILDGKTGTAYLVQRGDNILRIYEERNRKIQVHELPNSPPTGSFPNFMVEMQRPYQQVTRKLEKGDIPPALYGRHGRSYAIPNGMQISGSSKSSVTLSDGTQQIQYQIEQFENERVQAVVEAVMH
ncbi:MAG: SpoIIE family protein phosphatase [Desulfobacterales bacterium]|nr:SpoIIE family protein phosphatase [Desulfobacterales bacterium]